MRISRIVVVMGISLPVVMGQWLPVVGETTPQKKWKNVTELSVVSANGNTKSTTSSGKNTFTIERSKTGVELVAGGLGAKSNGETTAEKYFASEKVTYKVSDRNYVFEKAGWEKDRFAGIRNRYDPNVGLGRELIATPKNLLIAEAGLGYVVEERVNSKTVDFASGRLYSKYTRTISDTSNFTQDAEYLHNFEDASDFRINTESALTAALSAHFSLKVSYRWQHVGEPPLGFARNDTTTSMALIASY